MTSCRRGEVVVVRVPSSDQSGFKARPALVVSAEAFPRLSDVIALPEPLGVESMKTEGVVSGVRFHSWML